MKKIGFDFFSFSLQNLALKMNLIERGLSTAIVGVRTNFNNITNLKSSIE